MFYIYQIGVVRFDEGYTQVKERYEHTGALEVVRKDARHLLDKLDSGIVVIVDDKNDYVEQIGDYDGNIQDWLGEIDEKAEKESDYII